jgi:hypothetical protein
MLRPLPIACLAMLLVNDDWLKSRYPGVITGKLSDVAGLALLTFVVAALADVTARIVDWRLTAAALVVIVAVPAIGFALVKLSPAVANVYGDALGVRVMHDVSDLFALAGSLIAGVDLWGVLKRRGA